MDRLVFSKLGLDRLREGAIADLGCGVGGVSRHGSRLYPNLEFHAMTVSKEQAAAAKRSHAGERVTYYCGDYHRLPFGNEQLQGVFYLESLCYSTRPDQALAEAARTLKPGARLVITDGYLARPLPQTSRLFQYIVKTVAHNWAVPMFHEIDRARQWTGGGRLKLVEEFECGWRLGFSALHSAHLSAIHFIKLLLRREVTPWQWDHLRACAFTIALGLYRRYFRYHVLVFEKQ
jgi:SAM-dependent methyltransferase